MPPTDARASTHLSPLTRSVVPSASSARRVSSLERRRRARRAAGVRDLYQSALDERGTTPDFLIGTCVGALNDAFVASRPQSPQTATELDRVWRDLQRQDVFPLSMSALCSAVWAVGAITSCRIASCGD